MFNWAVEWLWLGVQFLVSISWIFVIRRAVFPVAGIPAHVWTGFFLLVTAVGALSAVHAAVVLNIKTSASDISDIFRFLIFIPLALFIGASARTNLPDQLAKVLKIVILVNLSTAAVILLNVPVLADAVMFFYAEAKIQFDFGHIRIGIPFTNPNFAAFVFVLALGYFTFFRRSSLFVALTLISLFLTGSRSGLLSAAPILVGAYLLAISAAMRQVRVLVVLLVVHALALIWLSHALEAMGGFARILELIEALQAGNLAQVDTASIRMELLRDALRFIDRSPILGVGPGRSYGLDITDSQLIAWPVMYGIPLALMIGGFFAWMFLGTMRRAPSRALSLGVVMTAASFFLMLSTGDFLKNYRLFFISVLMAHGIHLAVIQLRTERSRGMSMDIQGSR
jgi:O-antigen ligase